MTERGKRARRRIWPFPLTIGLHAVDPPIAAVHTPTIEVAFGVRPRQGGWNLNRCRLGNPVGTQQLPAVPAPVVEQQMSKAGHFSSADRDMLCTVTGTAIDHNSVAFGVIAPVPCLRIHANWIGDPPLEENFQRLACDASQHEAEHVHRRIPIGIL